MMVVVAMSKKNETRNKSVKQMKTAGTVLFSTYTLFYSLSRFEFKLDCYSIEMVWNEIYNVSK